MVDVGAQHAAPLLGNQAVCLRFSDAAAQRPPPGGFPAALALDISAYKPKLSCQSP